MNTTHQIIRPRRASSSQIRCFIGIPSLLCQQPCHRRAFGFQCPLGAEFLTAEAADTGTAVDLGTSVFYSNGLGRTHLLTFAAGDAGALFQCRSGCDDLADGAAQKIACLTGQNAFENVAFGGWDLKIRLTVGG